MDVDFLRTHGKKRVEIIWGIGSREAGSGWDRDRLKQGRMQLQMAVGGIKDDWRKKGQVDWKGGFGRHFLVGCFVYINNVAIPILVVIFKEKLSKTSTAKQELILKFDQLCFDFNYPKFYPIAMQQLRSLTEKMLNMKML